LREDEAAFIAQMIQEKVQTSHVISGGGLTTGMDYTTGTNAATAPGDGVGDMAVGSPDCVDETSDGGHLDAALKVICNLQASVLDDTSASFDSWQTLEPSQLHTVSSRQHPASLASSGASISLQAPSQANEVKASSTAASHIIVSRSSSSNSTVGTGLSSLNAALQAAPSTPERGVQGQERGGETESSITASGRIPSADSSSSSPRTMQEREEVVEPGLSLIVGDETRKMHESQVSTAVLRTPVVFWEGEKEEEVPSCFF
jgi:hypothetical protein